MNTDALWFVKPGRVELRPVELPEPGPEDVILDVRVCGVCQFDVHIFAGNERFNYPTAGGHESVGVVAEVGRSVTRVRPGDPVAISGGGSPHFARRMVRRQSCLHRLPDGIQRFEHWLVEPVSCAVNGIECTGIAANDRVAVIGCGFMGLLLVQGLRHTTAREIVAADLDAERLALAKDFGAQRTYSLSDPAQLEAFKASKGDRGYDVVFEAAGAQKALDLATSLVRMAGKLNIFGLHWGATTFDGFAWHMMGLHVLNVSPMFNPRMGEVFAATPALMARGQYELSRLVSHVAPAEQAQSLFETAAARQDKYMKGAVRFS